MLKLIAEMYGSCRGKTPMGIMGILPAMGVLPQ
jgi:hypothetical protein